MVCRCARHGYSRFLQYFHQVAGSAVSSGQKLRKSHEVQSYGIYEGKNILFVIRLEALKRRMFIAVVVPYVDERGVKAPQRYDPPTCKEEPGKNVATATRGIGKESIRQPHQSCVLDGEASAISAARPLFEAVIMIQRQSRWHDARQHSHRGTSKAIYRSRRDQITSPPSHETGGH